MKLKNHDPGLVLDQNPEVVPEAEVDHVVDQEVNPNREADLNHVPSLHLNLATNLAPNLAPSPGPSPGPNQGPNQGPSPGPNQGPNLLRNHGQNPLAMRRDNNEVGQQTKVRAAVAVEVGLGRICLLLGHFL